MTHLGAATTGTVPAPAGRVLVVDDSDQLVRLVAMWLEDEHYLVTTATTGARALASVRAATPDVVLLDLILPQPDGFSLCPQFACVPRPPLVIVMTALSDPVRLRQLDGLGVFDVLQKPLSQEMVLESVSRARSLQRDDQRAVI
jgi:CheY-like chemotaxis protein